MRFVVAAPLVGFVVLLAYGALTRRVKIRNCCCPAVDDDLRLRDVAPTNSTTMPPIAL
ncbi:MAG: hypothetical protein HY830_02280 [Actinobacteria bacterium]|nr:hypothetical protein [Actinomycetota bacterium]